MVIKTYLRLLVKMNDFPVELMDDFHKFQILLILKVFV